MLYAASGISWLIHSNKLICFLNPIKVVPQACQRLFSCLFFYVGYLYKYILETSLKVLALPWISWIYFIEKRKSSLLYHLLKNGCGFQSMMLSYKLCIGLKLGCDNFSQINKTDSFPYFTSNNLSLSKYERRENQHRISINVAIHYTG